MFYAFLAYFFWGFFPMYWKLLKHIPTMEILAHRVLWAFIFYGVVIFIKEKKWYWFKPTSKKQFWLLVLASVLLMVNWLIYIYAVNSNQIVESSLGYFINPLVNVLIGVYFLKERLSKFHIISIILATIGVGIIGFSQGGLPWIALVLAVTFSLYGFLKKITKVPGLHSNQFESMIFVPIALGYLAFQPMQWLHTPAVTKTLFFLIGSGLVTGIPLIIFAEAAQRIPYYLMGFFQFLAPTLQFLSGVVIFNEELSKMKLLGFIFIWGAVLFLVTTSYVNKRKKVLFNFKRVQ